MSTHSNSSVYANVFDRVTAKIITDLERGVRPWQKPWHGKNATSPLRRPRRHNGLPYNGVNILLLWDAALERGYQNSTWMTFHQAADYGARVRKGERASWIVYANKVTKTEMNVLTGVETERQIPFLRGYSVFNVEQIDGLPQEFHPQPTIATTESALQRLDHVDQFLQNTRALIEHGGNRAFYSEGRDYIQMPELEAFIDRESYYATLTHEITHWTKHKDRLNRDFGRVVWGDEGYAKEELVAEIGSAFLCADLGITPEIRDDHAAYIDHWLRALKNDRKLIFAAASHATKAVEFIQSRQLSAVNNLRNNNVVSGPQKPLMPTHQLCLSL